MKKLTAILFCSLAITCFGQKDSIPANKTILERLQEVVCCFCISKKADILIIPNRPLTMEIKKNTIFKPWCCLCSGDTIPSGRFMDAGNNEYIFLPELRKKYLAFNPCIEETLWMINNFPSKNGLQQLPSKKGKELGTKKINRQKRKKLKMAPVTSGRFFISLSEIFYAHLVIVHQSHGYRFES